jgi:hypothetical protein
MKLQYLFILLLGLLLGSCSSTRHSLPDTGMLDGVIFSIGNDPFTKLGIQVENKSMIILRCSKEVEKELRSHQGQQVRILYDAIEDTPDGISVLVKSFQQK